jgi:L-amino acid N-acyltransferase YncA
MVRDLRSGDWPEVARIYQEGIATGNATFETEIPSWEAWDAGHLTEHRFVAVEAGRVVG